LLDISESTCKAAYLADTPIQAETGGIQTRNELVGLIEDWTVEIAEEEHRASYSAAAGSG
jgi:hypothetical protein